MAFSIWLLSIFPNLIYRETFQDHVDLSRCSNIFLRLFNFVVLISSKSATVKSIDTATLNITMVTRALDFICIWMLYRGPHMLTE